MGVSVGQSGGPAIWCTERSRGGEVGAHNIGSKAAQDNQTMCPSWVSLKPHATSMWTTL
jgi:hypothetical protein